MGTDIVWHGHAVQKSDRSKQKEQKPCMIWFTGLSGAGKSTLANALDLALNQRDKHTYLLDGDNVRFGLNKDLSFTDKDRIENIRRIGEVGRLMVDAGLIVLSAFISPFRSDRQMVRTLFPPGDFIEVHVATSLDVCEERDTKGLYAKARAGQISNFTGIDSAYEIPPNPELSIDTQGKTPEECVDVIIKYLETSKFI